MEVNQTEADDTTLLTNNDSDIVRETLRLYGTIYAVCLLCFALWRVYTPRWFNIKSWSGGGVGVQSLKLAQQEYSWFSWFWEVFFVEDIDLLEHCGMDALCFLRALRFGRKLALLGCFNALWLIPMYRTAEPSEETSYLEDAFVKISVSNLPSQSIRFGGTVLATYLFFFYTMKLMLEEYHWFTAIRHVWMATTRPRNYAVYVSGIPEPYRTSHQLETYFSQCGSQDAVYEAHIVLDTPKLDKLVARRATLVRKLEHTVALEKVSGKTIRHLSSGWNRVNTVEALEKELDGYNRTISDTIGELRGSNDPHNIRRSHFSRSENTMNLLAALQQDADTDDTATIVSRNNTTVASRRDLMSVLGRSRLFSAETTTGGRSRATSVGTRSELRSRAPSVGTRSEAVVVLEERDAEEDDDEEKDDRFLKGDTHDDPATIAVAVAENDSEVDSNDSNNDINLPTNLDTSDSTEHISNRSGNKMGLYHLRRGMATGTNAVVGGFNKAGNTLASGGRAAGTAVARTSMAATNVVAKTGKVAGAQLRQTANETGAETLRLAQTVGANVLNSAGAVLPMLLNKAEGTPRDAGFVVFKSLYAAQTALQMIHNPRPYVMSVSPAADPDDIFWRNVGMPAQSRRSGTLAAFAASTVLCFFWSIPMTFITSLTELSSLKESMPKLGEFIEDHPSSESFFAQVAPMVLLFFNEILLPGVLKYFAQWEGHISSALLEASLFVKLGCFMVIQTFFVSALSGSVMAEVTNILEDPSSMVELLANSLPAQSSFFIQVILAQTFFLQSIEILRVYPLFVAFLRRFFGPRLTEKERQRPWGYLHWLGDPPEFWHAETFAQLILFYMVAFVYNAIAPVTSFFLLFCFCLSESGYRYQFIHNYPRANDTGGQLWRYFFAFVMGAMVISQLTLLGLLALKQSRFASPAVLPLLAITILYILFLNREHSSVSKFLPTRDCILKDSENHAEGEMDMKFVKNAYLQPSLQNKAVMPDYEESENLDDVDQWL